MREILLEEFVEGISLGRTHITLPQAAINFLRPMMACLHVTLHSSLAVCSQLQIRRQRMVLSLASAGDVVMARLRIE